MKVLLKTLVFVAVIHGFFLIAIPWFLVQTRFLPLSADLGYFRLSAAPFAVLGGIFYFSSVYDFIWTGKGTPAAWDSPTEFVLKGGYCRVRNPMYVGMFLILGAEAVFFGSSGIFLYGIILWVCFHLFVVYHEEPVLRKKFGAVYETYLKSVPRWIPLVKGLPTPQK